MYYIFENDWSVLKSEKHMLYAVEYPEGLLTPKEYFEAQPLPEPFRSMSYVFSVAHNTKRPFPDNWIAGVMYDVFSKRMIDLLKSHEVSFETFTASLIDRKTGERLHDA